MQANPRITHLSWSISSTLGNKIVSGKFFADKICDKSFSHKPLSTEFIRTPKSKLWGFCILPISNIFLIVSLASCYKFYFNIIYLNKGEVNCTFLFNATPSSQSIAMQSTSNVNDLLIFFKSSPGTYINALLGV